MKRAILLLAALSACAPPEIPQAERDAICRDRLRAYDVELRFDPDRSVIIGRVVPEVNRPGSLIAAQSALRQYRCTVFSSDLPDLTEISPATLAPGRGRAGFVHVALLSSNALEQEVADAFSAAGYPVRTRSAPGLGQRVFLGPFGEEAAAEEALAAARETGFGAAYRLRRIP